MLALFYGTDRVAVRDKAKSFLEKNGAEQAAVQVDGGAYVPGSISEMVGAQSLFGGTEYFIIDTPSTDASFQEEVFASLEDMSKSSNVFVVLEEALLAANRKKYEKYTEVQDESTANKPERFNVFQIAEALAQKDKRKMWVLLQQVRALGIRDEETIGILWWQLKALRIAAVTSSPEEAEMKPYPYKKAKSAIRNFKDGEVESLSQSLIELYHNAHKGVSDMEVQLEQWVLTV